MPEQAARAKSTMDAAANPLDSKLLLKTLTAMKKGDFSIRLPSDWAGVNGKIADAINDLIEINEGMVKELERVSLVVGREGKKEVCSNETAVIAAIPTRERTMNPH